MKKLIAFDLDGTLLNTLDDLSEAVNYALRYFKYPEVTKEHVRKSIGNGVKMLLRRCVPQEFDSEPALIVFREYYKAHYNVYTSIYDGMKETLMELKAKGYLLAVISNKLDYISKDLINYYYPNIFDYIQGDTHILNRKPDPDMFNHVLKELNINKEDALYIGDTNVDYEFATNANVDVILVTYGYRTKKEMDEYHYNVTTVQSPKELLNLL